MASEIVNFSIIPQLPFISRQIIITIAAPIPMPTNNVDTAITTMLTLSRNKVFALYSGILRRTSIRNVCESLAQNTYNSVFCNLLREKGIPRRWLVNYQRAFPVHIPRKQTKRIHFATLNQSLSPRLWYSRQTQCCP